MAFGFFHQGCFLKDCCCFYVVVSIEDDVCAADRCLPYNLIGLGVYHRFGRILRFPWARILPTLGLVVLLLKGLSPWNLWCMALPPLTAF